MVTGVVVECSGPWMTVRFPEQYRCWSWAVVNGGAVCASEVAWLFLEPDEIATVEDVPAWFRARLEAQGLEKAVGLLTSRRRHQYMESGEGTECHVITTVGLSNALTAGDPVSPPAPGTINTLCAIRANLTAEAALEAMALASEARTAAMMEAAVPSVVSGRIASGTGTDCFVIAHSTHGPAVPYCGKHTALGHRIGFHVRHAVSRGIEQWLREFAR